MQSTQPPAPTPAPTQLRGALYMLGAVGAFSCMDVTMKHLGERYPATQVTMLRGLAALPILLAFGSSFGDLRDFLPRR